MDAPPMEIRDNTFSRQFETMVDGKMAVVEYSFQERKIFLTRMTIPDEVNTDEFVNELLKNIMDIAVARKLKVVPVLPRIATFFRKHAVYRELLPPGIKL